MNEIDNVLKDFLRTSRSMENNIVSIISDSNRDVEMILKELLVYLDATSKNLDKVQVSINDFLIKNNTNNNTEILVEINNVINTIKEYHQKIVEINNNNYSKTMELVKLVGVNNQKFLKEILLAVNNIFQAVDTQSKTLTNHVSEDAEIKSLLKMLIQEIKETKINVSKNQDNLMTVIGSIIDTNVQKSTAKENVEVQKIKSEEVKFKVKLGLVGKIAGVLLGSGGIIYLLIDVILRGGN